MKNTKKKIIFINRYFYPDISATSQMLSGIAFGLAEENFDVHIITNRYAYNDTNINYPSSEIFNEVNVHRVWTSRFGRNNLIGRSIDYFSFYLTAFIKLLYITKSNDIVIAKTDPPLISIVALLVCKIKKAKLINWLQDLFPEVAKVLNINIHNTIYNVIVLLRNKSLVHASKNIVIGELMKDKIAQFGVEKSKIHIIENWADTRKVYPIKKSENNLRREWGLVNKFVVGYSGNMGRSHDFSGIMRVAERLRDNEQIVFLMIGDGNQKKELIKRAESLNLNMIFKDYQPINLLSESLSVPDVHIFSLKPELEGLIVPSKFYGIMAVKKRYIFIGSNSGEISRKTNKHNGIVVENDSNQIYQAIIDIYTINTNLEDSFYYEKDISLKFSISQWSKVLYEV